MAKMSNMITSISSKKSSKGKDKKAVVWVSTVIYTLIGLSVIALLLAVVRPKIAEMKDSFVISQTISALNEFDAIITEIRQAVGNTREYDLRLSEGEFKIHCSESVIPGKGRIQYIRWYLPDSNHMFSEATQPGEEPIVIPVAGRIKAYTEKRGNVFAVTLTLDYSELDLTFNGKDDDKTLQPAKTHYSLWLENVGTRIEGKQHVDISLL